MAYGNYLWFNWQFNGGILIDLEIESIMTEEKNLMHVPSKQIAK